jgi:2-polyprenyl-3-methyl-5-hydroxy-6-metoxy-1,4-benzoquinol methylase
MAKTDEIEFSKYKTRGAYHWEQIERNPRRRNAFVASRYEMCLRLWVRAAKGGMKGKSILDLGCGDGVLTYLLDRKGVKAHGIDVSSLAIELARDKHKENGSSATFSVASGYDTGLPESSLDGVISSDVIEHVQDPDLFLAEIKRVLKPGGVGIVSTPVRVTEFPLDPNHVVEWFPEEFKGVIESFFPGSSYALSHPVFWMELFEKSHRARTLINLLSQVRNPFYANTGWKYFSLQYAIVRK